MGARSTAVRARSAEPEAGGGGEGARRGRRRPEGGGGAGGGGREAAEQSDAGRRERVNGRGEGDGVNNIEN